MSDEALNAKIAAAWENAGLDASSDDTDIPSEGDFDEGDGDGEGESETESTDTKDDENFIEEGEGEAAAETETDTEGEEEGEEEEEKPTPATKEEKKAVEEALADLAEELGLGKLPDDPKKRAAWWKSRVPYSQLHKVVTAREKKLQDIFDGKTKGSTDRIAKFEKDFADIQKTEGFIKDSPEQYMKALANIFPDTYGKLFAPILGSKDTKAEELPKIEDPGPRPEPNLDLGNGNWTYDKEGYLKLMEWQRKVTEKAMLERIQPHLDFMDGQRKAAEKKQKEDAAKKQQQDSKEAVDAAMAEVKTWDLGEENFDAIVDQANKLDPKFTVREALNIAWRMVVGPKLKAKRDEMKADLLKEAKKKSAKKTSASLKQQRTGEAAKEEESNTDLDTRIKNAWRRAGLIK